MPGQKIENQKSKKSKRQFVLGGRPPQEEHKVQFGIKDWNVRRYLILIGENYLEVTKMLPCAAVRVPIRWIFEPRRKVAQASEAHEPLRALYKHGPCRGSMYFRPGLSGFFLFDILVFR